VHQQDCSLSTAQEKGKSGQQGSMPSSSEGRRHHIPSEIQKHCIFRNKMISDELLGNVLKPWRESK
jgi:hypothetical protein